MAIGRFLQRTDNLLNAVAATGAGSTVNLATSVGAGKAVDTVRYWVKASAVTTGGTMKIQGSYDGTNWVDLASVAVSANGVTSATVAGPLQYIRANLTARTDGTYTVDIRTIFKP